jgi:hypothetical protein
MHYFIESPRLAEFLEALGSAERVTDIKLIGTINDPRAILVRLGNEGLFTVHLAAVDDSSVALFSVLVSGVGGGGETVTTTVGRMCRSTQTSLAERIIGLFTRPVAVLCDFLESRKSKAEALSRSLEYFDSL